MRKNLPPPRGPIAHPLPSGQARTYPGWLRRAGPLAVPGLLLLAANLPVVLRYAGLPGALICTALGLGLLALVGLEPPAPQLWRAALVAALAASLLLQLFLLLRVAPLYDIRMDRDDALTVWWRRLAAGANPYDGPTSMGNPISILPFLHLVALPFILLGHVGYLPIAATLALAALLWRHYRHNQPARRMALIALAGAPLILFEAAGRSELVANLLLFVLVVGWAGAYAARPAPAALPWLGLLIGAVAATRFALWPALAVPTVYLLLRLRPRQALILLGCALLGFAALVLPFLLWDPAVFLGYAPFGVNASKLGADPFWRPFWACAALLTFVGACGYAHRSGRLFLACAALLAVITLATWSTFGFDVAYGQFIFIPLLFALPGGRP